MSPHQIYALSDAGLSRRVGIVAMLSAIFVSFTTAVSAQEESKNVPTARFVTVEQVGDETLGLIRRTGLELQSIATNENRKAYLILELKPATSEFHNVYALADFLTGTAIADVTTVAWVSEPVSGNNVVAALACSEIVMSPTASLGDIGRGKVVPDDRQKIIETIIARRRNKQVTEALVKAMTDPDVSLVKVILEDAQGERETRLVTHQEASRLLDDGALIAEQVTLKEPGTVGVFTGKDAAAKDFLAARKATSRRELAEAYNLPIESIRELVKADTLSNVAYIQLHHEIDMAFHAFAISQIDRALAGGAEVIIFDIDTPGGLLDVCMDLSSRIIRLNESGVRTIAYIANEAISGGAIISSACQEIYMLPDATIGDAMPISLTVGGGFVHADPKILSVLLEHMRMLAEKTNRPPSILEGFCDAKLEVFEVQNKVTGRVWYMSEDEIHKAKDEWVRGPRVPESRPEVAIFVNGRRANDLKIAETPVADLDELKERLGIPPTMDFQVVERSWVDDLVFWLNNEWITGMLFFLAIVCIYIEMATMTGFFGIMAAAAFGVFFWSRMLGGTASTLELSMFVLGFGCLALEIFVIPGFGVFGVSGILMIIGAIVMASMTLSGLGLQYDIGRGVSSFAPFAAAILGVIVFASIMSRYIPHLPILSSMVLTPPNYSNDDDGPRLKTSAVLVSELVGAQGIAVSVLRPAGKAQIEGQLYDVVSDGPYIQDGSQVTVVQAMGNRIVVREVTSA